MKKEKLIKKYDNQVRMHEKNRMNPTLATWREKLLQEANGKVLEVGVGVGSNFPYYDKENVHVTAVDFSEKMIRSAKRAAENYQIDSEFLVKDVNELKFEPNSFDCIVSTLTLCSYPNPVETINKFNKWCRSDGEVLLFEHGLSSNSFLTLTQKLMDPLFNRISGCHCDRDITQILEKSDLQVNHIERQWSDIIYLIWAKPGRK